MRPLALFPTPTPATYNHFSFDAADAKMALWVLVGLCFAIILAALYVLYERNVAGAFIRALLKGECLSPESAKTLSELGFEKNAFVKFEIAHSAVMQKTVRIVKEKESEASSAEEDDLAGEFGDNRRFYIPEELKYRAAQRFESKGNGPVQFILTAALAILVTSLVLHKFHVILGIFDGMLGIF